MRHCYLIGFRGSGKTTVGQLVAQRLGWPFLDTDHLIEQSVGRTIREIFAEQGEQGFRTLESSSIAQVAALTEPTVISLGGGAILREENRQLLHATGRCVWLSGDAQLLYTRIAQDSMTAQRRPNLTSLNGYDEVATLLAQREPLYRQMAHKTVMIA